MLLDMVFFNTFHTVLTLAKIYWLEQFYLESKIDFFNLKTKREGPTCPIMTPQHKELLDKRQRPSRPKSLPDKKIYV